MGGRRASLAAAVRVRWGRMRRMGVELGWMGMWIRMGMTCRRAGMGMGARVIEGQGIV